MDTLNIVNGRIKELERLITITPLNKSFTVQSRLIEARYILTLIQQKKELDILD